MSILDTFYILFDSDASKLDKGLEESEKKSEKLIDKLKGVDKEGTKAGAALYDMIGKAAGLLGVGLSIGALVAGVKSTAAAYEQLGKLAARFKDTADAIDEFVDAGELLDISSEVTTGALTSLDVAIQDTFLGMGRAKKVFEELGVTVTDAGGKLKPVTQVMGELAEKLKGMEKGTQIRIMERLGLDPSLLKMFNADFVALQKRMADIDRASGFNLDAAVKRAAEFTKATKGLSLEVNTLKMYLEKMGEGLKLAAMPFFTDALTLATRYVKTFVDFLLKHDNFLRGIFVALGAAIAYFLVPSAAKGLLILGRMALALSPLALLAVAVGTAFALLYDDIVTFMEGGDSMIGQILERWPVIGEIAAGIADSVKAMFAVVKWVFDTIFDLVALSVEGWQLLFQIVGNTEPFKAAGRIVSTMLQGVSDAFTAMGDVAGGVWDSIIDKIQTALGWIGKALDLVKQIGSFVSGGLSGARGNVQEAQSQLSAAGNTPLAAVTSNSINNSMRASRSTQVTVGKVEVKTAATDAEGISKSIGNSMQAQMRQAAANYDDGVLA